MNEHNYRRPIVGAIAALVATLVLAFLTSGVSDADTNTRVSPIDTSSRQAVANSYKTHVAGNVRLSAGWSGSTAGCDPGSVSEQYTRATIQTINWFRVMAGLPNVSEDRSDSQSAQEAALMMHAANSLSHDPGHSWACHSETGAGAAGRSNLTLGIAGPRGVIGQIEDAGAANQALGHRRWLLYPKLDSVGVGNTDRASAVEVIGNFGDSRSGKSWIAWPPAGYVPDDAVFDRWSISYNSATGADFSNASVSVTSGGRQVPIRVLPRTPGFGDATLAWELVNGMGDVRSDTTYRVTVSNVVISGAATSRTYDVKVFDADSNSGSSGPVARPRCHGMPATIIGTTGPDTVRGTPGPDVIVTFGGADRIFGGGGDDRICSGAGNDIVRGDGGNDLIAGGRGRDRIRGGAGSDSCWAHDTTQASNRRDRLRSCEWAR